MFYIFARHLLSILLIAVAFSTALAQKEASVWYFGNNAGLDFIGSTPTVLTDGAMQAAEGCATISSSSGKLLFYTNGIDVWNSAHQLMEGTGLLGDMSSTQSAIILHQPGNPLHYYIFTVDNVGGSNGLRYHVVDMNASGGLGRIIQKNEMLWPAVVEKLAVVRHSNRRDYWLVAHGWDNNEFYAFLITGKQVQPSPVISKAGTPHLQTPNNRNSLGAMKVSLDGKRLAVAIYEEGVFEILNFDASTGQVSNTSPHILLSSPDYKSCYGVEFSPDGQKLYGSIQSTKTIYQFDLALSRATDIVDKAVVISSENTWGSPGTLQLGPDGRIYCAHQDSPYLDIIDRPNEPGIFCDFQNDAILLKGATSALGLPLFYNDFLNMKFVYRNACPGDNTYFSIPDMEDVTSVWWNFGDPVTGAANTSAAYTPSHVYSAQGSYTVRLIINRGQTSDTVEREVIIHTVPEPPIPADTALCPGATMILLAAHPDYVQYEWSTGETTPHISIDKPGVYWVRVSDKLCTIADTVLVRPAPVWQITGTADTAICRGSELTLFADGGVSYQWTPEEGLSNPTSPTPVARPQTTTTYTVTATDIYGCSQQRSITITVAPQPDVELGNDTTLCDQNTLVLSAGEQEETASYLWSTGETTKEITIISPGEYWLAVRSGDCTATDTIQVLRATTPALAVMADTSICLGDSIALRATGALLYQWFENGLPTDPGATPVVSPRHTTHYIVHATGPGSCTAIDTVAIEVQTPSVVTVSLPAITAVVGNSGVEFPIALSASEPLFLQSLVLTVEFDASSLKPTAISGASMTDNTTGSRGSLDIVLSNITVSPTPAVYARLSGDILMGASPSTLLSLQPSEQYCITVQPQNGVLTILGCGIGARSVAFTTPTALAISPNPATGHAELLFTSASDGTGDISIYSLQGQRVWHKQLAVHTGNIQTAELPVGALAAGLYKVVLTTATDIAVATLVVQSQ